MKRLFSTVTAVVVCAFPLSAATVSLGTASGFGILSAGAATNYGTFVTNGEVGEAGATSGFPSVVPAASLGNTTTPATPLGDFETAYTTAIDATPTFTGTSLPGTLTPGVYDITSATYTLPSSLTFNGAGQYILEFSGSMTDNGTSFTLENGASASSIFFAVKGSDVIDPNSVLDGTLLVAGSASIDGPGTVNGRVLAGGSVSVYTPTGTESIEIPATLISAPEPQSLQLLGLSLVVFGVFSARRQRRRI